MATDPTAPHDQLADQAFTELYVNVRRNRMIASVACFFAVMLAIATVWQAWETAQVRELLTGQRAAAEASACRAVVSGNFERASAALFEAFVARDVGQQQAASQLLKDADAQRAAINVVCAHPRHVRGVVLPGPTPTTAAAASEPPPSPSQAPPSSTGRGAPPPAPGATATPMSPAGRLPPAQGPPGPAGPAGPPGPSSQPPLTSPVCGIVPVPLAC